MKKIMILAVVAIAAVSAFARPHGGGFRPGPMHHGGYHHHHGSWWGRGGRNFWPAFAGGVVGGMVGGYCYGGTTVVTPAVVPATTVVTTPTVVQPVAAAPVTVPVSSQPYQYMPLDTAVRPVEAYQQVWVPGQLVPVTRPDGTVTYVRQPGHYETVRVQ